MAAGEAEPDRAVTGVALSARWEQQLLAGGAGRRGPVPVLLVTGFLGAGKTTLVQHLLTAGAPHLRLGVLVNEVAALDVDSQLLGARAANAAAGVKPAPLAGGCVCCDTSGELAAALAQLAGSPAYQGLDCLLLETSGVADAEPLAAALAGAGFRLAAVVAVVDAEAGQAALCQDVAVAQLRAADVAVLNKCDLASLGDVAAVEDAVQRLAPGVRMLRARFGQVPPEFLLELEVEQEEEAPPPARGGAASPPPGSVHGALGFLSHEPIIQGGVHRPRAPGAGSARRAARVAAGGDEAQRGGGSGGGGGSHAGHAHISSVSFVSDAPLCMACFQTLVAQQVLTAPGLFRAKGLVWFAAQRSLRYVFHFSGKQRAECGAEGTWQGPPGTQLVLIGQQPEQLQALQRGLGGCVAGGCSCGTARHASAPAAERLADFVRQHHRLELAATAQAAAAAAAAATQQQPEPGEAPGLVEFSAIGSPLHGVVAAEVNGGLLRRWNATPGVFLCHVRSPPALAACGRQASYQGAERVQLCLAAGSSPDEAAALRPRRGIPRLAQPPPAAAAAATAASGAMGKGGKKKKRSTIDYDALFDSGGAKGGAGWQSGVSALDLMEQDGGAAGAPAGGAEPAPAAAGEAMDTADRAPSAGGSAKRRRRKGLAVQQPALKVAATRGNRTTTQKRRKAAKQEKALALAEKQASRVSAQRSKKVKLAALKTLY
ncbi:yciC [Scenedesmus sp. PABB004]|nr:yciC [Scenedesmus sp. PABB004]